MNKNIIIGVIAIIAVILAVGIIMSLRSGAPADGTAATSTPSSQVTTNADGSVRMELSLGQSASALDVTLTPTEVVEDSRCPADVNCFQPGLVRLAATIVSGLGTARETFTIGEPITTEAEAITLLEVKPQKLSTSEIADAEYRFVFRIEKRAISYANASSDMIRVTTPPPGAVTGKEFKIMGEARGNWFFEASFPVEVRDKDGKVLVSTYAQAQGEWMTTDFVPFESSVKVPESYIGPATIVLHKDNASGLPQNDASAWYSITIEY